MTRRCLLSTLLIGQTWDRQLGGLAASLLAQWIVTARNDTLAAGTEPMPSTIARAITGFFPPDLSRVTRWRAGGGTELTLPGLALRYGDAAAITLIDVVLFNRDADARQNAKLWAHELTHVLQYRRWGVDGFAARYVADSAGVEREAYTNAERFEAWRNRH